MPKNSPGTTALVLYNRIDFWLISESLPYSFCKAEISPSPLTDHKAIILFLNLSLDKVNKRAHAYLKLNSSFLFAECLSVVIKNKITEYLKWLKMKEFMENTWSF